MDNAINAFKPPSRKDYDATIYLLAENIPCRQYPLFMPSNKNTNKRRKHKHINELKGQQVSLVNVFVLKHIEIYQLKIH